MFIAQFVFFVALLGPAIVGVGIKISSLVASGAIPENGATGAAAVLGGFGALFATAANVVFGRLSDRTTSRWGRRRIWIVGGTLIMTLGLGVMAIGPDLMWATIGWSIAQLGANMTLAPFIATLADQVPRVQRGSVAAWLGIAQNAGVVGGVYVAQWFLNNLVIMFVGPALLSIVA
ncbi:MAG: MFS transporter, partial [Microbacterium sp. 14-71-5]